MYSIVFYEDKSGYSELYQELLELADKAINNKNARIQFNQINYCIELLKNQGTRLPANITKHLQGEIWELRPGNIEFCISFLTEIRMCFFICLGSKLKKHRNQKSKRLLRSVMISNLEGEVRDHENMGRL